MSERKVINKYYPPDYNPLEVEKQVRKLSKKLKTMNNSSIPIRLVTPFSIRCLKCKEFIPKRRKFNGKKILLAEKYLGETKIHRLSFKCPCCNNLITYRTGPGNPEYIMEGGGVRNYLNKDEQYSNETLNETLERLEREKEQKQSEFEEKEDKIHQLEQKLIKIQKDQQNTEELEEIQRLNILKMKNMDVISKNKELKQKEEDDLDDLIVHQVFEQHKGNSKATSMTTISLPLQPSISKKIQIKRKNRENPLGVIVRKKSKI